MLMIVGTIMQNDFVSELHKSNKYFLNLNLTIIFLL